MIIWRAKKASLRQWGWRSVFINDRPWIRPERADGVIDGSPVATRVLKDGTVLQEQGDQVSVKEWGCHGERDEDMYAIRASSFLCELLPVTRRPRSASAAGQLRIPTYAPAQCSRDGWSSTQLVSSGKLRQAPASSGWHSAKVSLIQGGIQMPCPRAAWTSWRSLLRLGVLALSVCRAAYAQRLARCRA